ncbi:MAG: hypothetical protein O7H41_18875 [Planctomycetota bacterium]|nr:hypothetical protein [Planctomycetota bacterium]
MTRQPMTKVKNIPWRTASTWEGVIGTLILANMMCILFGCIYWGFPVALHYPPLDRMLYRSNSRFINSTHEDLVVTLMGGDARRGRWPLRCAVTGWRLRTNHFLVKADDEVEFDYLSGFMSNIGPDCWIVEDTNGNFYKVPYSPWGTHFDYLEDPLPALSDLIRDRQKPIAKIPSYRPWAALLPLVCVIIQVILILAYRRLRRRRSHINKREKDHVAMDPPE